MVERLAIIFGTHVGLVLISWDPIYCDDALFFVISDLQDPHVDVFCVASDRVSIDKVYGALVVALYLHW